jgi:hypothetical protein
LTTISKNIENILKELTKPENLAKTLGPMIALSAMKKSGLFKSTVNAKAIGLSPRVEPDPKEPYFLGLTREDYWYFVKIFSSWDDDHAFPLESAIVMQNFDFNAFINGTMNIITSREFLFLQLLVGDNDEELIKMVQARLKLEI